MKISVRQKRIEILSESCILFIAEAVGKDIPACKRPGDGWLQYRVKGEIFKMSQAKVDRYKEEKKNRAKIIQKEKRQWVAIKAGMSAVAIAVVAWVGISVYQNVTAPDSTNTTMESYTVNTSAVDDFISGLTVE